MGAFPRSPAALRRVLQALHWAFVLYAFHPDQGCWDLYRVCGLDGYLGRYLHRDGRYGMLYAYSSSPLGRIPIQILSSGRLRIRSL